MVDLLFNQCAHRVMHTDQRRLVMVMVPSRVQVRMTWGWQALLAGHSPQLVECVENCHFPVDVEPVSLL
jgi:hypothetical protein